MEFVQNSKRITFFCQKQMMILEQANQREGFGPAAPTSYLKMQNSHAL